MPDPELATGICLARQKTYSLSHPEWRFTLYLLLTHLSRLLCDFPKTYSIDYLNCNPSFVLNIIKALQQSLGYRPPWSP